MFADQPVKIRAADSQPPCRCDLVSALALQSTQNHATLERSYCSFPELFRPQTFASGSTRNIFSGRNSRPRFGPLLNTTSRSIRFSSSRTLPGQVYSCKPSSDAHQAQEQAGHVGRCLRGKVAASSGISSLRSRRAGNVSGITFNR